MSVSQRDGLRRITLFIISMLAWCAVAAQFYLIILNRVAPIPETVARFFSFFTILTNLLVAICATVLLMGRKNFFSKPNTIAAIAVYITVVGLVYNVVLRFLWKPQGLQFLVDELLHTVIPALFIVFWLVFVPKARLRLTAVVPWLLYPLLYVICILLRGAVSGFYPYPFIDVSAIGYQQVFVNSSLLVVVFMIFSLLVYAGDKYLKTEK